MNRNVIYYCLSCVLIASLLFACAPSIKLRTEDKSLPSAFSESGDTTNTADIKWKEFFTDPDLIALIDTALENNQELNIIRQEIEVSRNEVRLRKGEYLPFVNLMGGAELEKVGEFTRYGAVEKNLDIKEGEAFPEPLSDYMIGAYATWEIDVWKKLRNAKKSAVSRYLASIEGKNFMVTNLISEIAQVYYELIALDNLLDIINQNINIQSDALHVIEQQKLAAKVTQLAVNRFEAQLLNTKNLQFAIKQEIIESENRLNFLTGRFPQPIPRSSVSFNKMVLDSIRAGIPSQLLVNRPDIRQAEFELAAANLDVKAARANFLPSVSISAGMGFQAFNPHYLISPESMLYNLAGELLAPLINRNAIKASYGSAGAKQIQAVYNYEQTILNAFLDVRNQLAKLENYSESHKTKSREVEILVQSITIANNLFYSARADYAEVLLTQREALDAKMEYIEIRLKEVHARINIYRALGGGWN